MKTIYLGLYLLWVPLFMFASNLKDTIPPTEIYSSFEENLNNLVNTWYVQEPVDVDSLAIAENDSSLLVSEYPDSFYINRLKKIPSLISLTYNDIVRRYIEVYTVKKKERLEIMLGLKDYYFPLFEEILDYYGLPTELKYLSVIESALNPRAVSRAGATGMWQFMYGTGRLYKLNINSFVDERRDPIAATHAAARFLKDLYSIYNDWILVIAAYNCGPGNVNKAIRRSGGKTNYWDIYYHLPRETRGYVPAYIGATYAMNYYKDHHLSVKSIDVPQFSDTIMVNENIHLQQVADVLNLPIQQLRDLNPQYKLDIVPGAYYPSSVRLPAQYATKFIDKQQEILQHRRTEIFSGEFKTITPASFRSTQHAAPPSGNMQKIYHKIQSGEALGSIAEKYHVRTADLRYWNNIYGNKIVAGKKLVIYVPKKKGSSVGIAKNSSNKNNTSEADAEYITYRVKEGDTLWKIASQYDGVTDQDLRSWNNLGQNSTIVKGQTIRIKKI